MPKPAPSLLQQGSCCLENTATAAELGTISNSPKDDTPALERKGEWLCSAAAPGHRSAAWVHAPSWLPVWVRNQRSWFHRDPITATSFAAPNTPTCSSAPEMQHPASLLGKVKLLE